MSRSRTRLFAAVLVLALVAVSCSNSKDSSTATTTAAKGSTGAPAGGEKTRNTFKAISGVPGVTDKDISFTAIGTKQNNPLGTCILDCYTDGIKAYFAYRNSEGGIYGRKLKLNPPVDDQLAQNQAKALEITSGNDAFGSFQATLLATGWGDLDSAGVPTYTWGINAAEAANRSHIFPSVAIRCADCTNRYYPYIAKQAGAKKAAALGYGVTESSKVCSQSINDSLKKYAKDTGVQAAYFNDGLAFGLPNGIGPEVTAMKKAGVDFILTCLDLNAMKTLAQELKRQGMSNVRLYHPNSYNQTFIADNKDLFNGDYVTVQFLPFEADAAGTALAEYKKWMAKQGSKETELSMVGWINATLAYQGLLAAGPEFNRDKVTAATNAMTKFTAGGLIRPTDWTVGHTSYTEATRDSAKDLPCYTFVKVKAGKFVTLAPPDKPWLCWSDTSTAWAEPQPTSFK